MWWVLPPDSPIPRRRGILHILQFGPPSPFRTRDGAAPSGVTHHMTSAQVSPSIDAPGAARITPRCPYFGTCGGCRHQDLAYADQVALKQERLQRAFASFGITSPIGLTGCEDPWRYRNKAELTFAAGSERLLLGFHAAGSFTRVVDIDDCLLLPEPAAAVLREVRELAASTGLPAYRAKTHDGFFRYLLLRSNRSGRVLAALITSSGPAEVVERMADALMRRRPELAGIYWGRTDRLADVAMPESLTHLRGETHLEEQIGPFRVHIHPFTFVQANTVQADRLYRRLADRLGTGETAWDLYCGAGIIGLYLAGSFRRVFGIDSEPAHGVLARANAQRNGIENMQVETGGVDEVLMDRRRWFLDAAPEAIVVDPPRAGLQPGTVASILGARPRRIGYVSCNLSSLTRDLRLLSAGFPRYRIAAVDGFDMFPHTEHVETLVLLER